VKSYYAARAAEYDRIYAKPERQDDLRSIEQWLPGHFRARRVLEVACGTGHWTRFIAPVAAHVVALDAAPETLAIARTRLPEGRVQFLVGDAYALPDEGGFDAAFAGFWISHVPKSRLRQFLVGLHAALRPGSPVVLLDNRYVEGNSSPVSGHDDEGNTYQERRLDDGSVHRVLKNFPAEDALRSVVAGLAEHVVFKEWPYYWAMLYVTPASPGALPRG